MCKALACPLSEYWESRNRISILSCLITYRESSLGNESTSLVRGSIVILYERSKSMARLQKAKKKEDLLLKCVCTHAGGGAGAGGHAGGPGTC